MADIVRLPKLKTRQEAADYLNVSIWTLNAWASQGGKGLPFYKVGRKTMYKESDLLAYLEANKQGHAEQPSGGDAA